MEQEEKELLESVENGQWKSIPEIERKAVHYQVSARSTLRKIKRVNIRMTERDFLRFQKTAVQEGLPYQTLISSILHKFITGRLVEKRLSD